MMTKQFSDAVCAQLNALERELERADTHLKLEQKRYDLLFCQVFDLFDQEMGEGPARFIASDGFLLARVVPQMRPVVAEDQLLQLITEQMPTLKGKRLIGRISHVVRHIDQAKLAREVRLGNISADLVQQCITPVTATPRRVRHKASAQDIQNLERGILESPESSSWTA